MGLVGCGCSSDSSSDEFAAGMFVEPRCNDCCMCWLFGFGAEIFVLVDIEEKGFGVDGSSEVDGEYIIGWE